MCKGVPVKKCVSCGVGFAPGGARRKHVACMQCKQSGRYARRRQYQRQLKELQGKFTPIQVVFCMICKKYFCRSGYARTKSRLCSSECLERARHADAKQVAVKFRENPFTFKLTDYLAYARTVKVRSAKAVPCTFCGSVKILGDQQQRHYDSTGRAFCDQECSSGWKSIHYRTPQHEAMEKQRQNTAQKLAELESRKLQKQKSRWKCCLWCGSATTKTKWCSRRCAYEYGCVINDGYVLKAGVVECIYCGRKKEFSSHASMRKYCSRRCGIKLAKQKRDHQQRCNGPHDEIGLLALAKKSKFMCACCGVKCVKPTGNNLPHEATLDHVWPLSKGGTHTWCNVQLLCRQCNTVKLDRLWDNKRLLKEVKRRAVSPALMGGASKACLAAKRPFELLAKCPSKTGGLK